MQKTPRGNPNAVDLTPPGLNDAEWWHTHPDGANAENFSRKNWDGNGSSGDEGTVEGYGKPGNLGTPSRQIKKMLPGQLPLKVISVIKRKEDCECQK